MKFFASFRVVCDLAVLCRLPLNAILHNLQERSRLQLIRSNASCRGFGHRQGTAIDAIDKVIHKPLPCRGIIERVT